MELSISNETDSKETLRPEIEVAQSTNCGGEKLLGTCVLLLPVPLCIGFTMSSTSTYSNEYEE